jgi:hypothetical protein
MRSQHYLEHGVAARRSPIRCSIAFLFARTPRWRQASSRCRTPRKGSHEGRRPNRWFDIDLYVRQHPDIPESAVNPLMHFRVTAASKLIPSPRETAIGGSNASQSAASR